MLAMLGLGVVIAVLTVVGLLKLTMREEPTGCIVVLGSLFLLLLLLLIVPQVVVMAH